MTLYLTYRKIPEMAPLNPRQRKLVFECAMHALFAEQPGMVYKESPWLLGGIAGGALAGWLLFAEGLWPGHQWLLIGGLAFIGLLAGNTIGSHLMMVRLRPYFRRVLAERQDELAQFQ